MNENRNDLREVCSDCDCVLGVLATVRNGRARHFIDGTGEKARSFSCQEIAKVTTS